MAVVALLSTASASLQGTHSLRHPALRRSQLTGSSLRTPAPVAAPSTLALRGGGDAERVFHFGKAGTDGDASMRDLLGGKGSNLAEMSKIGLSVPPGFTITTQVCHDYNAAGKVQALHSTPYTLCPAPHTLHSKPCTLHPKTSIPNPTPHTLNPITT